MILPPGTHVYSAYSTFWSTDAGDAGGHVLSWEPGVVLFYNADSETYTVQIETTSECDIIRECSAEWTRTVEEHLKVMLAQ